MSLTDMFGHITTVVIRLNLRWTSRKGVVHILVAHRLRSSTQGSTTGGWETLCESDHWEERRPKLTRKRTTCVTCLGLE